MSDVAQNFRSAEMVTLIKVTTGEGAGTVKSIYRLVTRYIDPATGEVVATMDPFPGGLAKLLTPEPPS